MTKLQVLAGIALIGFVTPAKAGHLANLNTAYSSRGDCEAAVADFNSDDAETLLNAFPGFFDNYGDVASFLTRAFPCEASDDDWFIRDRRIQVLNSDWYTRRH